MTGVNCSFHFQLQYQTLCNLGCGGTCDILDRKINKQASGVHETTFTRHSTGHIRCHHQSYGEADVDGERLPQGVSTEDGLSD